MTYTIIKNDSEACTTIEASDPKAALTRYKKSLMNSGFYELIQDEQGYLLCSTFGVYFRATPTYHNPQ